jgi:hypothetical protein
VQYKPFAFFKNSTDLFLFIGSFRHLLKEFNLSFSRFAAAFLKILNIGPVKFTSGLAQNSIALAD